MRNIKMLVLLLCVLALCLAASPASAGLPKDHKEYMKNEGYKEAFEQFTAVMEEAGERLTPDEYKALEKEIDEAMAASVEEDMESDYTEAEAWETAYFVGNAQVNMQLRWDWLRKNAEDAQGFYRLKSDAFEGYMTLEKGDEKDEYAVEISVVMKKEPHNSGGFDGYGKLAGGKMSVFDHYSDGPDVMTITFNADAAKLTSSKAFKESGELGAGVTLDGEFLREKK